MKTIKIKKLGIEVEKNYHFKDIKPRDIKEPKGWRALTCEEFFWLYNHEKYRKALGLEKFDEAILHPIKNMRKQCKFWALWLGSLSSWSFLIGNDFLNYDYGVRGVRFCRKIKERK